MRIICAPDSFKGSMTAIEAAQAMAAGIQKAVPDAIVDCCPIADGGEGTLAAFCDAANSKLHRITASGPFGDPLDARFATFAGGAKAIVESAVAVGLQLVPDKLRNPAKTSSYGVGELIRAATEADPRQIIVAIGDTASNDGGCGMAQALGIRFFDRNGTAMTEPLGGGRLGDISRIDATGRLPALDRINLIVASDVQNPLTGPDGAAFIYGPQKGAKPDELPALDDGLRNLASVIRRDLGIDIENLPGSGAAGGLGGGLVAFAGATIASGIDTVLEAVGFDDRVAKAQLCLTGEGTIDGQSLSGKAVMGVTRAASGHNVPTVALVGAAGRGAELCLKAGLRNYVVIGKGLPAETSIQQAAALAANAAGRVARDFLCN